MKNITNVFYEFLIALCCLMSSSALWAWEDMSMPRLHVEGRYLVDPHGNKVNLHGFAQTYSPWFNEMGQKCSYEGLEKILQAIDKARIRLDANVNMELAMELMLLVMKEQIDRRREP